MPYYIRKATTEDSELLLKWSNDPVVRNNSFNTHVISVEEHNRWFNKILNDDSIVQYIFMCDDIPVGQVRFDVDGNFAEVSYSIARKHRGKGYAAKMLNLATEQLLMDRTEVRKIIARIKVDNNKSEHVFNNLGYREDYIQMSKDIKSQITLEKPHENADLKHRGGYYRGLDKALILKNCGFYNTCNVVLKRRRCA